MPPSGTPDPSRHAGAPSPRAGRVAWITDRTASDHPLSDAFDLVSVSFERAEAQLTADFFDAIVVDATDRARLHEVASIALGGTRGVVVIGPPSEPAEAMRYLDVGAADYVSSRATGVELAARVRAVARSVARRAEPDDTFVVDDVAISLARREVRKAGEPVHLTPNEFAVLEVLAAEPGALVPHQQLIRQVWGSEYSDARHYLRLYVRQLREKLEDDPASPRIFLTEWGIGYRLASATLRSQATDGRRASA